MPTLIDANRSVTTRRSQQGVHPANLAICKMIRSECYTPPIGVHLFDETHIRAETRNGVVIAAVLLGSSLGHVVDSGYG
jgi:hypothetical protein